MNAFGYLKKIFNSFDFMGNRIKRLRVDTPENFIDDKNPDKAANPIYRENLTGQKPDDVSKELNRGSGTKYNEKDYDRYKDFVANKDYVDKSVDYNTELVKNQELGTKSSNNGNSPNLNDLIDGKQGPDTQSRIPSQFPWLSEDLNLYPNSKLSNLTTKTTNHVKLFGLTVKEVLDRLLFPRLAYKYKYPEFLSIKIKTDNFLIQCLEQESLTNKFLIYDNQDNKFYFDIKIDSGDFYNTADTKIEFLLNDGSKFNIDLISGETHITEKNDNIINIKNFFNNINKVTFIQKYREYIKHYDTWGYESKPEKLLNNEEGYRVDITEEFFKQCCIWYINRFDEKNNPIYIKQLSFNSNTTEHSVFKIKIPENIAKDYYLECYVFEKDSDVLLNTFIINQQEISNGIFTYNFGTYYPKTVYIKFKPIHITSTVGFEKF